MTELMDYEAGNLFGISVPTLVVTGEDPHEVITEGRRRMEQEVPDVQSTAINEAGHGVNLENGRRNGPVPRRFREESQPWTVVRSSERNGEATAIEETPQGAPKPEEVDGRESEGEESKIPPEVREEEGDRYHDKHGAAREDANPDQHRDEEEYD